MYRPPPAVTQPLVTGRRDGGRAERSHARDCAFSAAAAAMRAPTARAQVDSSQCCICGRDTDRPLACGCPFRHVFCDAVCFSARAFALLICAELDPRDDDDGAAVVAGREPATPSPPPFPLLPPPPPPPLPVGQQKHIPPRPPAPALPPPPLPQPPPPPPTSSRSTVPDAAAAASASAAVAAASSAAPTPRRQPRAPANKRTQADFIRRLEEAELTLYQTLANTRK